MFYPLSQEVKQNKKTTSPTCPATWETFRIICGGVENFHGKYKL